MDSIENEIKKTQTEIKTAQEAISTGFGNLNLNRIWLSQAKERLRQLKIQKARLDELGRPS